MSIKIFPLEILTAIFCISRFLDVVKAIGYVRIDHFFCIRSLCISRTFYGLTGSITTFTACCTTLSLVVSIIDPLIFPLRFGVHTFLGASRTTISMQANLYAFMPLEKYIESAVSDNKTKRPHSSFNYMTQMKLNQQL